MLATTTTTVTRVIEAPAHEVFDTVAHIENFAAALPHLTDVEFLTEQHRGVGTRFRETRVMKKREVSTELEVTEYEPDERIRLIADEGGTIWDTVFTVSPAGDGASTLTMVMEARAYKTASKIVNPFVKGMIRRAIEGDMDAVKDHCEDSASER